MECKYDKCDNEFEWTGNRKRMYCSDRCRMASKRTGSKANTLTEQPKANTMLELAEDYDKSLNRPPCTPDQLTSSCLTCTDKPTCSYLHNMNSALPGDKDYVGVCSEVDGQWRVA